MDELKESDNTEKSQPDIWLENVRHIPLDKNNTHLDDESDLAEATDD